MKREIRFTAHAWDDYVVWADTDRKMLIRINRLIEAAAREPFTGVGKPEPLRNQLSGCWSRRIDQEHRLVYRIEAAQLVILQCRYHYDA